MKTTITEDGGTNCSLTQTVERNTKWLLQQTVTQHWTWLHQQRVHFCTKTIFGWFMDFVFLLVSNWYFSLSVLVCIDTHSDPDESPSTVPALMLMATPFSWSGGPGLGGRARQSLEEDPSGDAVPGAFSHSSLWMRLRPFLSTIGESCFFFRIPALD